MRLSILHETSEKYSEQETDYWCGPASLQMILKKFNINKSQKMIADKAKTTQKVGTGRNGLCDVVSDAGLKYYKQRNTTLPELKQLIKANAYLIINFIEPSSDEEHYSVVKSISKTDITLDDPYNGENFKMSLKEFIPRWEKRDRWIMSIFK